MKFIIGLLVMIVIIGCGVSRDSLGIKTGESSIRKWHDDAARVTCWVYRAGYAGGISCLPDSVTGK